MKLNLLSTWTSEKITSLIFLTWLSANQVKAGQAFKNCLTSVYNDTNSYNLLLNFDNFIGGFCCNSNQCSPGPTRYNDCSSKNKLFLCDNFGPGKFCELVANVNACGGIVNDNPITANITLGSLGEDYCTRNGVFLALITNYLATVPTNNITGLEQGYAYYQCPIDSPCATLGDCYWDNGGWTCASIRPAISCFVQFPAPWPGPADKNPLLLTTSSIISSGSSTVSLSSTPEPNPHLTEKIAIPIGTTIGIGSFGGLAYFFWKTRKKNNNQQLLTDQEIELSTLDQSERTNQNELEQFKEESTQKKSSLTEFTTELSDKLDSNSQASLKLLLKAHGEIIKNGDNSLVRVQLERAKEQLSSVLSEAEIQNLLDRQTEVLTERLMNREEQHQTQIIQLPPHRD